MNPPNHYNRNLTILVTAFITMFVTSLVWVGIGTLGYQMMFRDPPQFEVTLDHPENVTVGEEFSIKVHVLNDSSKPLEVGNIDVYQDLLKGFEILDYDPKPKAQNHFWDYKSYDFNSNLNAAETFEFTVRLRAKEEGFWSGDIDVCTPTQNLITTYAEITVDPAAP